MTAASAPDPALCDQCQARPSTVFLTQRSDDGRVVHRQLCPACAALTQEPFPPPATQPPPNERPAEVTLPDPVTVRMLAATLRVPDYRVIAILVRHHVFKSAAGTLDFGTASLVCRHCGVRARRAAG